jgi:hypothetical protein
MIKKYSWMGLVAILLSSCGSGQAASTGTSSPPTPEAGSNSNGTLTAVNGQIDNPHSLPVAGTYEAQGLEMVVTATGATLNTGCTKGVVAGPIELANDGSFNTTGTMNPLIPMYPPQKTPLTIEGKYSDQDQAFSLEITFGPGTDPQPYNLVLNAPKNLDAACPG